MPLSSPSAPTSSTIAADHGDVLEHGRAKARRKGADLLAINAVGDRLGFGTPDNAVTIVDTAGEIIGKAAGTKDEVADALWDAVVPLVARRPVALD